MKKLLEQLRADYPQIAFVYGDAFYWSPQDKSVTYCESSNDPAVATWSLLHEVSHGILDHTSYKSDFELMELEVAAWHHALNLGKKYHVRIDQEHIQDCLDTYRDWLHRRSTCPTCSMVSVQKDPKSYECFNCRCVWHVSNSRFCRPYRLKKTVIA
ncbi:hypothetical protein H0V99_03225 [Candidatus Saccharibacteria bacterium]|nr:hypothetical protein [Candidatus Saccharibacteria bacterium]